MTELSNAARRARAAARQASPLRRDWDENGAWEMLARTYRVTLPTHGDPVTTLTMRRFLGALQRTIQWYLAWSGGQSFAQFAAANPRWGARALAGLMLEEVDREMGMGALAQNG